MKNIILFLSVCLCFQIFSCKKETQSDKFKLLTGPVWASDSLLVNGDDASGPGGMLEKFKGDVKFNTDYTGYFGDYTGTWRFAFDETEIVIMSDSLPIPAITAIIDELTPTSLKIWTSYQFPPADAINIRMTFLAK
jgi:hypothetical protein